MPDILSDSPSCFAAHSGCRAFQSEPSPPQHARACPRCVRKCVGVAHKAHPSPGPACDLTCALSMGPNTSSRCSCSTLDETTCCQPLSPPGSNASVLVTRGVFPQSKPATLVRTRRPRSVTSLLSPVLPTHLQALLPVLAQMQSRRQGASGKSLAWNLPSSPSTQKWLLCKRPSAPCRPRH